MKIFRIYRKKTYKVWHSRYIIRIGDKMRRWWKWAIGLTAGIMLWYASSVSRISKTSQGYELSGKNNPTHAISYSPKKNQLSLKNSFNIGEKTLDSLVLYDFSSKKLGASIKTAQSSSKINYDFRNNRTSLHGKSGGYDLSARISAHSNYMGLRSPFGFFRYNST